MLTPGYLVSAVYIGVGADRYKQNHKGHSQCAIIVNIYIG